MMSAAKQIEAQTARAGKLRQEANNPGAAMLSVNGMRPRFARVSRARSNPSLSVTAQPSAAQHSAKNAEWVAVGGWILVLVGRRWGLRAHVRHLPLTYIAAVYEAAKRPWCAHARCLPLATCTARAVTACPTALDTVACQWTGRSADRDGVSASQVNCRPGREHHPGRR